MAAYDLEEQEQLASIKAWWNQYGNLITWIMLAVAVAAASWQGWNYYQRGQSAQASAIFSALQRAAADNDLPRIKAASGELTEKFSGSAYAPMAALVAAKAAFESGDLKTAKAQLSWVSQNGGDELRDVARLRLAAVLLDDKAFDEALKQVAEPANPTFAARFAEMRGDILLAQGKRLDAKKAFESAIAKLEAVTEKSARERGGYRQLLQQKVDALGDVK